MEQKEKNLSKAKEFIFLRKCQGCKKETPLNYRQTSQNRELQLRRLGLGHSLLGRLHLC